MQDDAKEADASETLGTVRSTLSIARDATVIAAIYLYFLGFSYRYYFFDSFQIKSAMDAVPPYIAFVYSYGILYSHAIQLAAIAVVTYLVFVAVQRYCIGWADKGRVLNAVVVAVIAVGAFPLLNNWAWDNAAYVAKATKARAMKGNDVGLRLEKKAEKYYGDDFLAAAKGEGLHILARTDSYTYLLLQPTIPNASSEVFLVPNSQIASIFVDQN